MILKKVNTNKYSIY